MGADTAATALCFGRFQPQAYAVSSRERSTRRVAASRGSTSPQWLVHFARRISRYQQAILFVGLTMIQFLIGNYLEPRITGAALAISPFAVIFAVFFWSFLWGIPGAVIGVPITIAILTLCEHSASTRW